MATTRPPPAPIAPSPNKSFKAEKGMDVRQLSSFRRVPSGAGKAAFSGVGPSNAAAEPSPAAPQPAPAQPTASVSPAAPKPQPKLVPKIKTNRGFFSCCGGADDVDDGAPVADAAPAADAEPEPSPAEDAPAPVAPPAPTEDASPHRSSVSVMDKIADSSKLTRRDSVLNSAAKPATPTTAAAAAATARSASFRGSFSQASPRAGGAPAPLALSNGGPASPAAASEPSPLGLRRLSSRSTMQQQQQPVATSQEGGIRRAPSFTIGGASPQSAAADSPSGLEASGKRNSFGAGGGSSAGPSPSAFQSVEPNGDVIRQVSLVRKNSSFVMPSARDSALPPRPAPASPSYSGASENAPPKMPSGAFGARPSSASGELQKSKKTSNIVSGSSDASSSPTKKQVPGGQDEQGGRKPKALTDVTAPLPGGRVRGGPVSGGGIDVLEETAPANRSGQFQQSSSFARPPKAPTGAKPTMAN